MRIINSFKDAAPSKVITDLRHLVQSSAEVFGDKVLYYYFENDEKKEFTYNDLWENMNCLGTAFAELGLMGKHIAVIGETHPSWIVTYLAAVNGNSVIVPLDKELLEDQIVGFLNLAEVEAIVYTESFNNKLIKLADKVPKIKYFIPIHSDGENLNSPLLRSFDSLIEMGKRALDAGNRTYVDHVIDMDAMCAILFTSGTTGTSKGVMLSQKNLTAATNSSCQSMSYDSRNTFVSFLPPHHSYEMTCEQLGGINIGGSMLINDSLKHTMRNITSFKPNTLVLVPLFVETMYKKIWDEIKKRNMTKKVKMAMKISNALLWLGIDKRKDFFAPIIDSLGGNLKSIVCGGAPLNPQLVKDFYAFGITIFEGYGITECAPFVAVNPAGKIRLRSVGKPVVGCDVKIDYDEGQTTGEILVKGENIMMGYYKNEEATKAVFTEDGYFRTGDIGYMDKDNYIYITGRKKNVIILSNGKNVFPEEIEEYLANIPQVLESVVLGRKNNKDEIVITAIVVPDMEQFTDQSPDNIYSTIKDAITRINKNLPVFKQIKDIEIRYEPFEKNTSRKIKRYLIK